MKRVFLLSAIAAVVFGCAKEQKLSGPEQATQVINASIESIAGRAVGNKDFKAKEWLTKSGRMHLDAGGFQLLWDNTDQIKAFHASDPVTLNGVYTATATGASVSRFTSTTALPILNGETYELYSPAACISNDHATVTYPLSQQQEAAGISANIGKYVVMHASSTAADGELSVGFQTDAALIEFNVVNTGSDMAQLKSIVVESEQGIFPASVTGSSITYGTSIALHLPSATPYLMLSAAPGKFWMVVPGGVGGDELVMIRMITDKGTRSFFKLIPSGGFAKGYRYVTDLDWYDTDNSLPGNPFSVSWHFPALPTTTDAEKLIAQPLCNSNLCPWTPDYVGLTSDCLVKNLTRIDPAYNLTGVASPAAGSWLNANRFNKLQLSPEQILTEQAYVETTISAPADASITLQNMVINIRRPAPGPSKVGVCFQVGNGPLQYVATIASTENTGKGILYYVDFHNDLYPVVNVPAGSTVTLRLVPNHSSAGEGVWDNWILKNEAGVGDGQYYALSLKGIMKI